MNWLCFLRSLEHWLKHFMEWNLGFFSTKRIGLAIKHCGDKILVIDPWESPALELPCGSSAGPTWGPESGFLPGHTVHTTLIQGSLLILHNFALWGVDNTFECIRVVSMAARLRSVSEIHLSSISQWWDLKSQERDWQLAAQLSKILTAQEQLSLILWQAVVMEEHMSREKGWVLGKESRKKRGEIHLWIARLLNVFLSFCPEWSGYENALGNQKVVWHF